MDVILEVLTRKLHNLSFRRPNSGEAGKKPSRPSSAAHDKPSDKKKELDARERRRKEMAQNQVHVQPRMIQLTCTYMNKGNHIKTVFCRNCSVSFIHSFIPSKVKN